MKVSQTAGDAPKQSRSVRRRLVGAATVVALVGLIATIVLVRDRTDGALPGPAGWHEVQPADRGIFTRGGRVSISEVIEWDRHLLVVGTIQPNGADGQPVAWLSDDGRHWRRRHLSPPAHDGAGNLIACDILGGVAIHGDELVLPCTIFDDASGRQRIVVTSSPDLEHWRLHGGSELGPYLAPLAASGPNGSVIVEALALADPNATEGSAMRVWTSRDLETWTELEGSAADVMVNGQATRIRAVGDAIVLAGGAATYSDDGRTVTTRPAVWVSMAGSPFERTLLPSSPDSGPQGNASDVAGSIDGLVVVGVTSAAGRTQPSAWVGSPPHVLEQSPVVPDFATYMWSVVSLPDRTLVAVGGSDPPGPGRTWLSTDQGLTWKPTGPGPSTVGVWDGRAVGMSQDEHPRFWIRAVSS
jgi:hypothetical protein